MSHFTYNLQRVLDAREAKTSLCEVKLAQSQRRLEAYRQHEQACKEDLQRQACNQAADTREAKPAHELRTARAWMLHLANQVDQSMRNVISQLEHVHKQREELKTSLMEKKIIENHAKRQRRNWMEQARKREQKNIDEQAGNMSRTAISAMALKESP